MLFTSPLAASLAILLPDMFTFVFVLTAAHHRPPGQGHEPSARRAPPLLQRRSDSSLPPPPATAQASRGGPAAANQPEAPPPLQAAPPQSTGPGHQAGGAKRKTGPQGSAEPGARPAKQQRTDIRECVCPWWSKPYGEQLRLKGDTIAQHLRQVTHKLQRQIARGGQPEWLAAAGSRPDQLCCPLLGILRAPQLEGYRNKNEFTIGLDRQERPTVGFLLGSFVDGYTAVAEPSNCRHTSQVGDALLSDGLTAFPAPEPSFFSTVGEKWQNRVCRLCDVLLPIRN